MGSNGADLTVVTGGSSGIGAAIASHADRTGSDVVVVSRTPGDVGAHLAADLTEPAGWDRFRSGLEERLAAGDVTTVRLFHCAGTITPIGFAGEVDDAAYRRNVILNAAAPQIVGNAFLEVVRRHDVDATLVMLTSGAARSVYPGWSSYCAAKAGVDHWVRTVAAEQDQRLGVKVVAIAPGVVDTPMNQEIRATDEDDFPRVAKFRDLHAAGELGDPDQVAQRIWAVVGTLAGGAVVDLRDL
ncbi:MAG: SDR family NAD(P)-dependent oxidoreductase [Acidimicrobiia bacterium]